MEQEKTKLIFQQIPKVMSDVTAIGKDKRNVQQGFQYRGIDDIYNELHSVLAKHKVFTVPQVLTRAREERASKSGGTLFYSIIEMKFTFYAEDGSSVDAIVVGEGMDSGDKASNKAMAIAHKYALLQVFAIPTEDAKDPDGDIHQPKPKVQPAVNSKPAIQTKAQPKPNPIPPPSPKPEPLAATTNDPRSHVIEFGQFKGKTIEQAGVLDVLRYTDELINKSKSDKKTPNRKVVELNNLASTLAGPK